MKYIFGVIFSCSLLSNLNGMETINKTLEWTTEKSKDALFTVGINVKSELDANQKVDTSAHGIRRYERAIESYITYHKDAQNLQALMVLYDKKEILPQMNTSCINKTHTFIIDESIRTDHKSGLISWLTFCKTHQIAISPIEASKIKAYFRECKKKTTAHALTQFTENFKQVQALKKLELEARSLGATVTDNESDDDAYDKPDEFYTIMLKQQKKLDQKQQAPVAQAYAQQLFPQQPQAQQQQMQAPVQPQHRQKPLPVQPPEHQPAPIAPSQAQQQQQQPQGSYAAAAKNTQTNNNN